MNIYRGDGGRSSSKAGDSGLRKVFLWATFASLFIQVYTVVIEWNLKSLHELNKDRNNWYALQGAKAANIDLSRGGQIAFVPAFGAGYGFYNRAYPQREINLYLPKSKDGSSEEHRRRKHRRPSSDDHHKSAKQGLNDEHAEQAEISAQMAQSLAQMIDFKKSQLGKHVEMRDEELSQGNEDAAEKEQTIIDIYQDQIKYLEGIQEAEEAIVAGEASMYYDNDGAGRKRGHRGDHHKGSQEGEHHDGNDHAADKQRDIPHDLSKRSPFGSSLFGYPSPADSAAAAEADAAVSNAAVTASAASPSATSTSVTTDASVTTSGVPSVVNPDTKSSSWLAWFGGSNDKPTYSAYTLLQYLSPADKSSTNLMSMFNVYSDPSNSSYLSNASTIMRIAMFFMPGTGIVDQVYFTMALSKIMWEGATMYYEGYGMTEIAVVVLGDTLKAAYLSRRSTDSIIDQTILTPGDTINIDGMEPTAFLKYVNQMKYPDLTEDQELKLQTDIDNLVTITYPNMSPDLRTTFTAGLKDTLRFLALFNVQGDLHVENVDVNFSTVYINMHSSFDESAIEKIKKTILSAIDAVKSKFS